MTPLADEALSPEALRQIRTTAEAIAERAGARALLGFRQVDEAALGKKGAIDLVTEHDLAVEQLIVAALRDAFPDHRVVGEETAAHGAPSSFTWHVDPIDGTTNFAHGHPFFCSSLGLYRGNEPLVGVLCAPALGSLFSAAKGQGATRNGKPMKVSTRDTLSSAIAATGFSYDRRDNPDNNLAEFSQVVLKVRGMRRCGSAALDLAFVADGVYDLYWEKRLGVWDLAGGLVLVQEAGGRVTNFEGGAVDIQRGEVCASNGHLHDSLLSLVG